MRDSDDTFEPVTALFVASSVAGTVDMAAQPHTSISHQHLHNYIGFHVSLNVLLHGQLRL